MPPRKRRRRVTSAKQSTVDTSSTVNTTSRKILLRCINPEVAFREEVAYFRIEELGLHDTNDVEVRDSLPSTERTEVRTCAQGECEEAWLTDFSESQQPPISKAKFSSSQDRNEDVFGRVVQKFRKYDLRKRISRPNCSCCQSKPEKSASVSRPTSKLKYVFPSCASFRNVSVQKRRKWGAKVLPHRFRIVHADPHKSWNSITEKSCCPYCPASYGISDRKLRSEHIASFHPYRCSTCKLDFKHQLEKKIHHIHEHVKEQHHCLVCEKIFVSQRSYEQHSKGQLHKKMLDLQWRTLATVLNDFFNLDVPFREDLSHLDILSTLRLIMAGPDVRKIRHESPALEQVLVMLRSAAAASLDAEKRLDSTTSTSSVIAHDSKPTPSVVESPNQSEYSNLKSNREESLATVQPKKLLEPFTCHSLCLEDLQKKEKLKSLPDLKEKSVAVVHPLCRDNDTATDGATAFQNTGNVEKRANTRVHLCSTKSVATCTTDFPSAEVSLSALQTSVENNVNHAIHVQHPLPCNSATTTFRYSSDGMSYLQDGCERVFNTLMHCPFRGRPTDTAKSDTTVLQAGSEVLLNEEPQSEPVNQSSISTIHKILSADIIKSPVGSSKLEKSQELSWCFTSGLTSPLSSIISEEVPFRKRRISSPEGPQLPNFSSHESLPYWNDCSPLPNASYFSLSLSTPLKHSSSIIQETPEGMSTPIIRVLNSPFQLPSPQRLLVTARRNALLYNQDSGIMSVRHCLEFEELWQKTALGLC